MDTTSSKGPFDCVEMLGVGVRGVDCRALAAGGPATNASAATVAATGRLSALLPPNFGYTTHGESTLRRTNRARPVHTSHMIGMITAAPYNLVIRAKSWRAMPVLLRRGIQVLRCCANSTICRLGRMWMAVGKIYQASRLTSKRAGTGGPRGRSRKLGHNARPRLGFAGAMSGALAGPIGE